MMNNKPAIEFYGYLQDAFDFFNEHLYDGVLSSVMFTITRKKNTAGYFRKNGWQAEDGSYVHEIAVNPNSFITSSPLEIYQTLVHEMCHQWQREHGKTDPRKNYHNKEWVDKMLSMGLQPISKNGKGTGQSVSDTPIVGGKFEELCRQFFIKGYKLNLVDSSFDNSESLKIYNTIINDRLKIYNDSTSSDGDNETLSLANHLTTTEASNFCSEEVITFNLNAPIAELYDVDAPVQQETPTYTKKTAYKCPNCGYKVWGAPNLPIGCLDCHTGLLMIND